MINNMIGNGKPWGSEAPINLNDLWLLLSNHLLSNSGKMDNHDISLLIVWQISQTWDAAVD